VTVSDDENYEELKNVIGEVFENTGLYFLVKNNDEYL